MASNSPAQSTSFPPNGTQTLGFAPAAEEGPWEEWNPTEDSVRAVHGRRRAVRQRGGGLARNSTVLGVGVLAAVGAGGMAAAQPGKPPVSISLPDLASVADSAKALIGDGSEAPKGSPTAPGRTAATGAVGAAGAGEALRARIMRQAQAQQAQQARNLRDAAQAAEDAAVTKAAAAAARAQDDAQAKAAAEKAKAQEAARRAELAEQYALPTSAYTLTSRFGDAGAMWSSGYHTGLDFAAPTGTLLKAIHSGTITEAGWAGAYGYRTVLTLDDGTELWFCHQSSISVTVGQQVATGDVIGRVGATGNVTGPHLHLEVHPQGGAAVDPMAWLRDKGLNP